MKFYEFNKGMPYYALIWAKNQKQAFEKYEEVVCDIHGTGYNKLKEVPTMDVDDVLKLMSKTYEDDAFVKLWGVMGRLIQIISIDKPQLVVIDVNLA